MQRTEGGGEGFVKNHEEIEDKGKYEAFALFPFIFRQIEIILQQNLALKVRFSSRRPQTKSMM